ncbi:uncharacterized protein NECHADRAFT_81754 [Fusarium vanettenii 77-13-4]|uniref:Uncharacterized protein n=1 Tax=Fusarium vanettenii (strain ATCC MYA-4622 / CBS 123669 / FGSC 9596 / NRRL 45880 / 77-13-4) TaxID=660122 RepID=C7Z9H4_FUSV7|nr:uncharacterized protein NECHADRAFT_81754 [Fusarium vanettenii 77-13-4]EEU39096.1 predicted protein [Fusarium vanettenii 77-13-4]
MDHLMAQLAVIHMLERHRHQPVISISPIQMVESRRMTEEEEVISWCDKYDQHKRLFPGHSATWGRNSDETGRPDVLDTQINELFELTEALGQQCDLYKKLTPKKKLDGRPDHDAYHLHHREWIFSRNIIKAFRLLPKKMQSNIEMTFGPLHSLVDPREADQGKGQAQMDMRRVLGIMLANPTQPARDVILNMTGAQASLVLRCADYSFSRLLNRMLEVKLTKQRETSDANNKDWKAYYYALMNYRGLWRSWRPASLGRSFSQGMGAKQGRMSRNLGVWSDLRPGMLVRELSPDNQFVHDGIDERGDKPKTDEICKAVHDFAVAGGTPHIDHLVNDIWDWVTAPDYAFSARPGDSLLGAMQLPESLQRNPKIKPLGPDDLEAVFGPAIGDLATVLSYFQLALWVSTGMATKS